MSDQIPSQPNPDFNIEVPDSLDGVLTARDYRKTAQAATMQAHKCIDKALFFSVGRSGLTDEEKVYGLQRFKAALEEIPALVEEAIKALDTALEMSEKQ